MKYQERFPWNRGGERMTAASRIATFEKELGDQPMTAIAELLLDGAAALKRVRTAGIGHLYPEDAVLARRTHAILGVFRGIPVQVRTFHGQVREDYRIEGFVIDGLVAAGSQQAGVALREQSAPEGKSTGDIFIELEGIIAHHPGEKLPTEMIALDPADIQRRYVEFRERQLGAAALAVQTV